MVLGTAFPIREGNLTDELAIADVISRLVSCATGKTKKREEARQVFETEACVRCSFDQQHRAGGLFNDFVGDASHE